MAEGDGRDEGDSKPKRPAVVMHAVIRPADEKLDAPISSTVSMPAVPDMTPARGATKPSALAMIECPTCHVATPAVKFCSDCGAPLVIRRFCSECGAKLTPGSKFCEGCGAKLE
jgi:uncharacterized OB-fold protein